MFLTSFCWAGNLDLDCQKCVKFVQNLFTFFPLSILDQDCFFKNNLIYRSRLVNTFFSPEKPRALLSSFKRPQKRKALKKKKRFNSFCKYLLSFRVNVNVQIQFDILSSINSRWELARWKTVCLVVRKKTWWQKNFYSIFCWTFTF